MMAKKTKLRGAEWIEQSKEERASRLNWFVVSRVKRIRPEQSEWIKEK